jgi:hypothetical protein
MSILSVKLAIFVLPRQKIHLDFPLQFFLLPCECKKFDLFKSVEHNNRLKKQHFLNWLNKITDLKSSSKRD